MTRWQRGSWYEYIVYVYLYGIKRWNFKYEMYIWQSVILKLLLMLDCKIVLEHTSRTSLMSWRRINGSILVSLCVREHVWLFILSVLRLISLNGDWESVLKKNLIMHYHWPKIIFKIRFLLKVLSNEQKAQTFQFKIASNEKSIINKI